MPSTILHHSQDDSKPKQDYLSGFEDPWASSERDNTDSLSCAPSMQGPPKKIQKKRGRKLGSFRRTPKILKNFVTTQEKKLSLREKITLSVKENNSITDKVLKVFVPELQPETHKTHPRRNKSSPMSNFSALLCSKAIVKSKIATKRQSAKARNNTSP